MIYFKTSPATDRRSKSEDSNKGRHVVIKTNGDPGHISVLYSPQGETSKTPLLQEYTTRPSTLLITETKMPNRSKSIDNQKKTKEKLQRFKEKILHSSPELNDTSDNESTPLVSEVSSPSKSGQSSEIKSDEIASISETPTSQTSLSPDIKLRFTRSELNLTDTEALTKHEMTHFNDIGSPVDDSCLTPHLPASLSRTMSESTSISGVLSSCSNTSISRHSSGQLPRQNALEENLADCYCDPSREG